MSSSPTLAPTSAVLTSSLLESSGNGIATASTSTLTASDGRTDGGVIAGAVFGCLYVIIVTSLVVYCYLKKKREKAQRPPAAEDTLEKIHQRLQREETIKNNLVAANASQQQESA